MAKQYILALDQGTTSSRAMVVDETGAVISIAQHPFKQIFPKPGWVEHSPTEIWSSQSGVATEALAKADLTGRSIVAIGITNQRETTIVWDRETGEPIHNAIVWQDRRTAEFCDKLRAGEGDAIQAKTGLIPDAYFSGSKVRWILENVSGARARAEAGKLAFGTVDSWLIWKLTKGERHVTDVTNASRTMLFNIHTMDWDDDLLRLLGVPRSLLPEVVASSGCECGTTRGLLEGVPITGIAGDQQSALFGQMCTSPGMAKCTYGTGAFMLLNIGKQPMTSKHRLLTTVAWKIGETVEYAFEGSMLMAGAVVQWLRDELQMIRTAAEIESLAASVSSSNGVVLVPAFAGLGAPHWDQYARGSLFGLTRGSSRAHVARAALEGIALQATDVLEAMQADSRLALSQLRVDGGAAANNLLMQIQADVLGIEVVRPKNAEATVLGAAYLAGLAVGYWPNQETIASQWQMDRIFEPAVERQERDKVRATWRRALERAKQWTKEEEMAG